MKIQTNKPAFTLMELLIVIAIIALLVTIMFPSLNAIRERAYKAKSAGAVSELSNAALQYKNATTYYPGQEITPGSITGSQMLAACLLDGINANDITSSSNSPTGNYIEYSKDRFASTNTNIIRDNGNNNTTFSAPVFTPLDQWKSGEEMAILYFPSILGNTGTTVDTTFNRTSNHTYGTGTYADLPNANVVVSGVTIIKLVDSKFGNDQVVNSDSFLMIAPSLDRHYFLYDNKCDDITNY